MEIGHDSIKGEMALSGGKTFAIGRRETDPVGELHEGEVFDDVGEEVAERRLMAELPEVERQPHRRVIEAVDPLQGLGESRHESTADRGSGMVRLEGEGHASAGSQGSEDLERFAEQTTGMPEGVAGTAPGVDDEHVGPDPFRRLDRLGGVIDALTERATVASGESAGPLQARDPDPRPVEEFPRLFDADIRDLGPPQGHRIEAVVREMVELDRELPAVGRQLADRHLQARDTGHGLGHRSDRSPASRWKRVTP